jgi:hypothetical protein
VDTGGDVLGGRDVDMAQGYGGGEARDHEGRQAAKCINHGSTVRPIGRTIGGPGRKEGLNNAARSSAIGRE